MKKKKLNTLALNKEFISSLGVVKLDQLKGGGVTTTRYNSPCPIPPDSACCNDLSFNCPDTSPSCCRACTTCEPAR